MGDTELKLPPCKVCGSKASGLHFGVISCEACKAFYKRSQSRNRPYPCRGEVEGACEVKAGKTLMCPHCRLLKCTSLGMSRQGISKGRVPIEKKAELLLEAMEYQQRLKKQLAVDQTSSTATETATSSQSLENSNGLDNRQKNNSSGSFSSNYESNSESSGSNSEAGSSPDRSEPMSTIPNVHGHFMDLLMTEEFLPADVLDQTAAETEISSYTYDTSYLEWFIQTLYQADLNHPLHDPADIKMAIDLYDKYVESRRAKEELMGPLPPMAPEVYNEIYNATGIDLDDYRAKPAIILNAIEKEIMKFTTYLKALPGFQDLSINDKVTLAKGGFHGWSKISSLSLCRIDSKTGELLKICHTASEVWTQDDSTRYFGAETSKKWNKHMTVVYTQYLSPYALSVLKMLHVYVERSDCGTIEDKATLASNQQLLREAFMYQLEKEKGQDADKVYNVILTALQGMEEALTSCENVMRNWTTEFPEHRYPKILKEVMGIEAEEELVVALTQLNIC